MNELLRPDDTRDALRAIGALLFGVGVLMLLLRKATIADDYSDGIIFILLAIPAILLYGGSIRTLEATGGLRPWQAVWSVFGLIFVALALIQLVTVIDDTPDASLNLAWIFAVVAALGFYAGAVKGVRFQLLVGGLALIVAWSELWNKILGDEGIAGHYGTYRGLLGILAIILLVGALYLWRTNPGSDQQASTATGATGDPGLWKASELLTAAGISAVIACSLGVTSVVNLSPLTTTVQPIDTSAFWDVLLLVISLGLVGLGSLIGVRGPVYIGAIGLFLFLIIAGLDLDSDPPDPTKIGLWPILLIALGGGGIVLSLVKEASLGDGPRRFIENLRRG